HDAGSLVHDSFLVECITNAHNNPAVDLALGGELADKHSTILHAGNFFHFHEASFRIDFDLRELHAARATGRKTFLPLTGNGERIDPKFFASASPLFPARILDTGLFL